MGHPCQGYPWRRFGALHFLGWRLFWDPKNMFPEGAFWDGCLVLRSGVSFFGMAAALIALRVLTAWKDKIAAKGCKLEGHYTRYMYICICTTHKDYIRVIQVYTRGRAKHWVSCHDQDCSYLIIRGCIQTGSRRATVLHCIIVSLMILAINNTLEHSQQYLDKQIVPEWVLLLRPGCWEQPALLTSRDHNFP